MTQAAKQMHRFAIHTHVRHGAHLPCGLIVLTHATSSKDPFESAMPPKTSISLGREHRMERRP